MKPAKGILNREFRYVKEEASNKEGYLARKWDRLYPGWRRMKKEVPESNVTTLQVVEGGAK